MASFRTLFACFAFMFLFTFSESREFLLGGKENSWKIPSSPDDFNKWAGKIRFLIGDSLVLTYDAKADSVLQVSEDDYKSCNKAKTIKSYNDGHTKIELDRSGPFFFISGAEGHCEKGQKLEVKVLSAKHGLKGTPPVASQAPAPAPAVSEPEFNAPAPAPNSGVMVRATSLGLVLGSLVGLALV
ncbi:early nodulin-like protein 14 [Cornus florida]|uniref:early nodulin-like protein 14 n=1 Tax=Cornus florida TaxID=4283 RepID=UPI00289CED3E|nr:early nodulin-like protein 14 [Cornus florida]